MARNKEARGDRGLSKHIDAPQGSARITDPAEPRAASARYDRRSGRIEVELKDGCLFAFPVEGTEGLHGAAAAELEKVEVAGDGYALHWDDLDVHYTVPGLLAGRFGSRLWMREHARRAGSVKSEAKARAARRNGLKGGRPRGSGKGRTPD